jgi:hypothetical protein
MHDKTMKEPREALLIALKKLEVPVNRGAPRQPVDRFPEGRLTNISMDRPRLALMTHQDWQEFERKRGGSLWQEYGLVYTSSVGTAPDARNLKQELRDATPARDWRSHSASTTRVTQPLPYTSPTAFPSRRPRPYSGMWWPLQSSISTLLCCQGLIASRLRQWSDCRGRNHATPGAYDDAPGVAMTRFSTCAGRPRRHQALPGRSRSTGVRSRRGCRCPSHRHSRDPCNELATRLRPHCRSRHWHSPAPFRHPQTPRYSSCWRRCHQKR